MIPAKVYEKLKSNWGPRAESLNCFAEYKLCGKSGKWAWYLLAVDPEDDETVKCIMTRGGVPDICTTTLSNIELFYDEDGELPEGDREFRPMRADVLYSKLLGKV